MTPQQTKICFEFACLKTHITSIERLATLNTDDVTTGVVWCWRHEDSDNTPKSVPVCLA